MMNGACKVSRIDKRKNVLFVAVPEFVTDRAW